MTDLRETDLFKLLEAYEAGVDSRSRLALMGRMLPTYEYARGQRWIDHVVLGQGCLTDLGRAVLEALRNDERYRALKAYDKCENVDALTDAIIAEQAEKDARPIESRSCRRWPRRFRPKNGPGCLPI